MLSVHGKMYHRRKCPQNTGHRPLPGLGSLAGSRQLCTPSSTCSCLGFTWDRSHLPRAWVGGEARSPCKSAQPVAFPGWISSCWWANTSPSNCFQKLINAEVQTCCLVSACLSLPQVPALYCDTLRAMLRQQERSISSPASTRVQGPLSSYHGNKQWEWLELILRPKNHHL